MGTLELWVADLAPLVRVDLQAHGVVEQEEVAVTLQDERDRVLQVKDVRGVPVGRAVDVARRSGSRGAFLRNARTSASPQITGLGTTRL